MAEIYRDTVNKGVTFPVPGALVNNAWIDRKGVETSTTFVSTSGATVVRVPYSISRFDGKFDVCVDYTIEGGEYIRRETHEIVSPLFTKEELVVFDSDFSSLDEVAVAELERIIRTIFEVITGQTFGYTYDTVLFPGSGSKKVSLPKRAIEVRPYERSNAISAYGWTHITNDGWVLNASPRTSWIDKFETGSIETRRVFKDGRTYALTGFWGYHSVPEDIKTAAKILASDYGCDQSLWRDRWIKSIRASDWRLEFDSRAYILTGNVKVDQILDKFTVTKMVVL